MSLLDAIGSGPVVTALGWALVHFIWQGALLAAVLAAVLGALPRRAASARYVACCAGMGLMALAPVATFSALLRWQAAPAVPAAPGLTLSAAGTSAAWGRLADMLPQLTALWIVGVCLLQLRFLFHWVNAQRIKARGGHPAPEPCLACVADLCGRLGIRRTVRIFEANLGTVPMLIGWLRPVILVPAGAVTGLSPQQLRAVLAHELAHVRRHDYLVNVLQAVFESLLFYHPAVWWLSHRLRVEREYCCDDVAVGVGGDALSYAQALSYLDTLRAETYQPALASTGGTLMIRIRRLLGLQTVPSRRIDAWLVFACAVVATLSAVGLARPIEGGGMHPHHEEDLAPVHEFHVRPLVETLDAREAALIRVLRDAGLDDRTLAMVLEAIDADPRVLRAIRDGRGRRPVAAGRREAGEQRRAEPPQRLRPEERLHRMQERIEEDLAAGRITEEQAREQHERALARHEKFVAEGDRRRETAKRVAEKLNAISEEIQQDLEAGVITEDEARERMHRAMQEIHERLGRRLHGRRPPLPPPLADKMRAIHEKIAADLEAGVITEDEARERLIQARKELHEQLEETMEERPPGRRGPDARRHREAHEEAEEHVEHD